MGVAIDANAYPSIPTGKVGDNEVTRKAIRHIRGDYKAYGAITLHEGGEHSVPAVEADDNYLRIGCTSISYEAFRKVADWWEQTRKSNVRKMQ